MCKISFQYTSAEKYIYAGLFHEVINFAYQHAVAAPGIETQDAGPRVVGANIRTLSFVSKFDLWSADHLLSRVLR